MKPVPKEIKVAEGLLRILWSDGHASRYALRDVRMACRCAACVDEWTHQSLLVPERIPADIRPTAIEVVGSYAVHITWSDGHSTGIYSYDVLRELCGCEEHLAQRTFNV
jgi:DUF971 family protein